MMWHFQGTDIWNYFHFSWLVKQGWWFQGPWLDHCYLRRRWGVSLGLEQGWGDFPYPSNWCQKIELFSRWVRIVGSLFGWMHPSLHTRDRKTSLPMSRLSSIRGHCHDPCAPWASVRRQEWTDSDLDWHRPRPPIGAHSSWSQNGSNGGRGHQRRGSDHICKPWWCLHHLENSRLEAAKTEDSAVLCGTDIGPVSSHRKPGNHLCSPNNETDILTWLFSDSDIGQWWNIILLGSFGRRWDSQPVSWTLGVSFGHDHDQGRRTCGDGYDRFKCQGTVYNWKALYFAYHNILSFSRFGDIDRATSLMMPKPSPEPSPGSHSALPWEKWWPPLSMVPLQFSTWFDLFNKNVGTEFVNVLWVDGDTDGADADKSADDLFVVDSAVNELRFVSLSLRDQCWTSPPLPVAKCGLVQVWI